MMEGLKSVLGDRIKQSHFATLVHNAIVRDAKYRSLLSVKLGVESARNIKANLRLLVIKNRESNFF